MQVADYSALADRVLSQIQVHPLGCWEFTGELNHRGYGTVRFGPRDARKREAAHRIVYKSEVGPIGPGLTIDHLCRNKRCVNPAHLEVVTRSENVRRQIRDGQHVSAGKHEMFCKHGHEMTAANTYRHSNKRRCRACALARARANYAKRK